MSKLSRKKFFQGLAAGTLSLPFVIKALSGDSQAQRRNQRIQR